MAPTSPSAAVGSIPCAGRSGWQAWRRVALSFLVMLLGLGPRLAHADATEVGGAGHEPARGLAVLGLEGGGDAAWSLAHEVYADASLRPAKLDEASARVLVGEPAARSASPEILDLAESRAAVHGDDAPSRHLLASVASSLGVKGIVVVQGAGGRPTARVFVASARAFDAVLYESDAPPPVTWGRLAVAVHWSSAVQALRRGFADADVAAVAPVPVGPPVDMATPGSAHAAGVGARETDALPPRPFYRSPWFWAAAGAALFAAGAVYFATRGDDSNNIQLQLQVPR